MHSLPPPRHLTACVVAIGLALSAPLGVLADRGPQPLPFAQDWSDTALITTDDDWSTVPGIEGYLGQGLTSTTGADPQTLLGESTAAGDLDLLANRSNPDTLINGGVAEFDGIANPTIALNGSGTADAPYLLLSLDTTGASGITVSYTLRDLDGSPDDATQQVALQYRVGDSGAFTNVPEAYIGDATGPDEATMSTPVRVTLPADADEVPLLQVRIITTNAPGNDEWVGIDDLLVEGGGEPPLPPTFAAIHEIQGSAASSPLADQLVMTRGVVTALRSNGFFLQTPAEETDDDPSTSEGIFVFLGATASVARGDLVEIEARVTEFVPSADPHQPPLTELASPSRISVLSSGHAIPEPIALTPADMSPGGPIDALERFEGMRVAASSLTVVGPTLGSVNESAATATSNGVFYAVSSDFARPFREPGIGLLDPLPSGAPPNVPRFDTNPERLRVDSDAQLGAPILDVSSGAVVTNLIGTLDYAFRTYTLLPDPPDAAAPPGITPPFAPLPVRERAPSEFTVASANLQRFFDDQDDPSVGEPVLSNAAFQTRLEKASLLIRTHLDTPDILGVVELENLQTLEALATRVSADAVAASEPDPAYDAYLVEGNDPGGIDVGFLVKGMDNGNGQPRVAVTRVTQEGATATYVNPNTGALDTVFDRPPLVLEATVSYADGTLFPITVIVNHLRSLIGIDSEEPSGTGTGGARVRAKRQAGAEHLASFVQARQEARPDERLVLIGDFNAFELNDGYVDVIGTIAGQPADPDEVVLDSDDLVNPDLLNLVASLPQEERYTFVFDGNAQLLDHVLVNSAAAPFVRGVAVARGNADAPEVARNDPSTAFRLSDHDVVITYFGAPPTDLTEQAWLLPAGLHRDPRSRLYEGWVVVHNRSQTTFTGPLHLGLDQLTPGVTLVDATGMFGELPFVTLEASSLAPWRVLVVPVQFANPNAARIQFGPRLFRGLLP
ncbi:MAG: hypothetical protein GEV06_25705 [Luteitalea sp.]|nr:hypothetical protein [Luteitalea sp.]